MEHIPPKISQVLDRYFTLLDEKLPNFLEACYLYGSVSLGAYQEGESDLDFFAVSKQKATDTEITLLTEIHREMQRTFPTAVMDGLYVGKEDFASVRHGKITGLRFHEGKFRGLCPFEKDSIDAYQLQTYGIAARGKPIDPADFTVDWTLLLQNMRDNLNSYWLGWLHACKKFPSLHSIGLFFSLRQIEWGVLGVSRLYYTCKEKEIASKIGAGRYALQTLPPRWHPIIREAMRLRTGNKKSHYRSRFERRADVIGYLEYLIRECNRCLDEEGSKTRNKE